MKKSTSDQPDQPDMSNQLTADLLEVAYRELREKGTAVTAEDMAERVNSLFFQWRDAMFEEQAERTARSVPHERLVRLWPAVHRLLWDFIIFCRPDQIEIFDGNPEHQSLMMGHYLAWLRYENKVKRGLLREVKVSSDEAAEWLERKAWLINRSNPAQPGLPF